MKVVHELPIINEKLTRKEAAILVKEMKESPDEYFYVPDEPQYRGKSYEEILEIRKKERATEP